MTLLWKRRYYLLSSRFTVTFPFLTKQQRKYRYRRLPANFISQILCHFQCLYTNPDNDAFEGLFLSSSWWNSWTYPSSHPVLPTFWSLVETVNIDFTKTLLFKSTLSIQIRTWGTHLRHSESVSCQWLGLWNFPWGFGKRLLILSDKRPISAAVLCMKGWFE